MTNLQQLEIKIDALRERGLSNINFYPGEMEGATVEGVAGEMVRLLDAIEAGEVRPLVLNDSRRMGGAQIP